MTALALSTEALSMMAERSPDLDLIAYRADRVVLCAACAEMRYSLPSCSECGVEAKSGWPAAGRPHRDCPLEGHFQATDDSCNPIEVIRYHDELTCDLCDVDIPARHGPRSKQ